MVIFSKLEESSSRGKLMACILSARSLLATDTEIAPEKERLEADQVLSEAYEFMKDHPETRCFPVRRFFEIPNENELKFAEFLTLNDMVLCEGFLAYSAERMEPRLESLGLTYPLALKVLQREYSSYGRSSPQQTQSCILA